ncbi:group I truncated hemoglobin [Kordiimonas pumila]|uniref:Group 1 truncated hemoglobin n=1 Tax=Kordiimonas pumila TaxID=2161677 RepID=A0ABV7D2E4_9PROT|nr:group 1 truncated hemoglobin [Kordiimonas pumila]
MKVPSLVSAVFVMASVSLPASAGTLFDDLGGMEKIQNVASRTLDLALKDELTRENFRFANMKNIKEKLSLMLCEVADGPCVYDGAPMKELHDPMDITTSQFNAVVESLQQAMREEKIPFSVQNRLIARLAPLHSDIVTVR